ncbi:hypothetical protein CC80DRAFT_581957 [Byssothecium circinans]|uniref:lytic cellulose monooxygenase (C4-dehydrogenating) n=1 Tax=Byssothecium circinans TaxID=147558 RepID=A0A6A5TBE7_9PLEO|nr:hypothetical protein CC80DRAFT_581957 [Byssothecium circinans]
MGYIGIVGLYLATMKSFTAILAFSSTALAHWNYDRLIHKGAVVGNPYEYICQTTNSNSPVGADNGNSTEIYEVAAGDSIGFVINSAFTPDTAAEYDGSGDWTKIYSGTTSNISSAGLKWSTDAISSFVFDLPAELPAGEYLVRAEGLALHSAGSAGGAQWYIACAQVKVTGSGSGTLSPSVKIPGVYKGTKPGILIGLYYPVPTNYSAPGPALWPAGTSEVHSVKSI